MKRRNVLKSVAGAAGIAAASGLASATDCSGVSDWDSGATYQGGDQAVYDGSLWEAQWWSQGDEPGSSQWGPWEEVGDCGDGGDEDGGDEDDGDHDDGAGNCSGVSAWDADATYSGGDQAVYEGSLWEAQWWTQGDEPGSSEWGPWEEIGPCEDDGGDDDDDEDDGDEDDGDAGDLEAVISAPARVSAGEEFTLDASGSSGDIESYQWIVGDIEADSVENTLSLDDEGSYDIELTVSDADGNSASADRTVFVGTAGGTPPGEKRVIAYFRQWAQYDREYYLEDVPTDKITHLQYAFARPEEDGSINLVGDSHGQQNFWSQGEDWRDGPGPDGLNFAQLAEQDDSTEYILSIGGWGDSEYFSNAALTEENRQRFADDCLEWIERGNLDGVDLDWEFPHGGGCTEESNVCDMDNIERDGDIERFTKLCETVRETLDEAAAEDPDRDEPYEVTAAVNADPEDMADYEHDKLKEILDFIMIMTFDYAGIWSETTRHHAPLRENPDDPFEAADEWNAQYILGAFEEWGWDPDQLHMSVPFYGRSWTGILPPDDDFGTGEDDGLFQEYEGEDEDASGDGSYPSWGGQGTSLGGIWELFDIVGDGRGGSNNLDLDADHWETYIDEESITAWSYTKEGQGGSGESLMISHDTVETMEMKAEWLRDSPYGGTMLWAIGGDTDDNRVIDALWSTLNE